MAHLSADCHEVAGCLIGEGAVAVSELVEGRVDAGPVDGTVDAPLQSGGAHGLLGAGDDVAARVGEQLVDEDGAASDCEAKAVSKAGKPLTGAAKAASIKKCEGAGKPAEASKSGCAEKAVSKAGKPLAGAAKTTFMKKCEADAKAAK